MKISKKLWITGSGVFSFLVVAFMAIAVNVIVSNISLRKDLTEEKLYELSDGTHDILKKLDVPVTLKFFFSGSNPEIPVYLKNYARRVEDLLREYELAGKGNVLIEKYDPKPDSDAEEWAQKYGVAGQSLGFMGPTLFLGLVASLGDTEAVLPVLDPRTENLLEYNITRMITRVAHPEKPVIGVISSLPVLGRKRSPYPMPGQPPPQPAWFAFADLRQDYDVREISTPVEEIEEEIDALILVHPKDLSDGSLYAIDQFVLRGGRLLAFLDPMSVTEAETQTMPQMRFSAKSSNIEKLLDAWGVSFDPAKVVADLKASSRLRAADNRIEENPVWLSLRKSHFNADDILTAHIESIMMPYAGSFSAEDSEDVKITTLISSSESSDLIDAMTAQFGSDEIRRQFKGGLISLDLAIRLHGKLKTAFPDGRPETGESDDEGTKDDEKKPDTAPAGLTESAGTSTVVLVGDADMLYDRFCVQEVNFFGFKAHQPINDNLTLFVNIVEQIAGSASLVSIRTRGKTERPFDVVLDLQRRAQDRYMEEENRLQAKLQEAQQRLNELQARKDEKQRFILSPQQQREIRNFQEQVTVMKKELKLVRRKLREDIENLGIKVKLINILLMPALVSVAGVGFGLYRRRRTR